LSNCLALICSKYAPSIPKENFTAMTRLDQNRAQSQIAARLGVGVENVKNVIIWGNHSSTQYPDARFAVVKKGTEETKLIDNLPDTTWLQDQFISVSRTKIVKTQSTCLDSIIWFLLCNCSHRPFKNVELRLLRQEKCRQQCLQQRLPETTWEIGGSEPPKEPGFPWECGQMVPTEHRKMSFSHFQWLVPTSNGQLSR